jgi:ATP-dependent DNA ligase
MPVALGLGEVPPVRILIRPRARAIVYREACRLGCEGIVSKRLGSPYCSGRVQHWVKIKNPAAPAVKREAEEDWGNKRWSHARRRALPLR